MCYSWGGGEFQPPHSTYAVGGILIIKITPETWNSLVLVRGSFKKITTKKKIKNSFRNRKRGDFTPKSTLLGVPILISNSVFNQG